jgi:hypothetical protein
LHGSLAPDSAGSWGPAEYDGTMADSSAMIAPAHAMIPTMKDSDVLVRVTWPDSDNSARDRVQVEVSYQHKPLVPGICPWGTLNLRSVSTMHIVN